MRIYQNIYDKIGNTPIVKLNKIIGYENLKSNIYAKIESFNPLSSVKDRAVYFMLQGLYQEGKLKEGMTVVEASSGNTGIALSYLASFFGCKAVVVMPENMSDERKMIIRKLGAGLELSPAGEGMSGAIAIASKMVENNKNFISLNQFSNRYNLEAHYRGTGPEIWSDMVGNLDFFTAGVGTGGTITGTGLYLKEKNKNIKIVAIEPYCSSVLSGYDKGKHGIQGIGAGFIPEIFREDLVDSIYRVKEDEALKYQKMLSEIEGIFAGISSGAAVASAVHIAKQHENANIVALLPDTGERYLSV